MLPESRISARNRCTYYGLIPTEFSEFDLSSTGVSPELRIFPAANDSGVSVHHSAYMAGNPPEYFQLLEKGLV